MRSYEAARGLLGFLGFLAWCAIVGGVVVAIGAGSAVSQTRSFGVSGGAMAGMVAAMPGLILAFLGFLALAQVQTGRAGVDTAEYTQQMLKIARDQLEVSKQSLKQSGVPRKSFEAQRQEVPEPVVSAADGSYQQAISPSTTEPPSPVQLEHLVGTSIEHGPEQIEVTEDGYVYGEEPFPTLEAAKAKVDEVLADKILRSSAHGSLGLNPALASRNLRRR
ncbi:hypothetical protein [Antarctobacter sp.]|uniref:hypothetical protein n=1 Tax=Antarctobacter sp. TaxID=1872577 RepID=UPI002B26D28A|nr:hypothetical protein [Antarctobacter sp.]